MIKLIVVTVGSALFFTSCSSKLPEVNLVTNQALVKHRANQSWWRQLNDTSLNQDVSAAFAENPSLQSVAVRVGQADVAVAATQASTLPRVNLGFGYQEGRRREVDFGPYDLVPWQSQAGLSWEVDLSGKLKAAKNAAVENRNAVVWDVYSARLMLASRIAKTRMNLIRLNADISNLEALLASQRRTLENSSDRSNAGLIPDAAKYTEKAEIEKITRAKQDLQRLRDLAVVQLRTLRGGSQPKNTGSAKFPKPPRLASRSLNSLLSSHPSILAAEARVRAAFQLQQSAQLDLLPSFQINLLASGAQKNLAERFRIWTLKAGPSLNIPIYDPIRMAKLNTRKSQAKIQSAKYKEVALRILEEVDTARINLISRKTQLATAQRETKSLLLNKANSRDQLNAGIISQVEYLNAERQWLSSKLNESTLKQSVLSAYIDLMKATGGGRITQ